MQIYKKSLKPESPRDSPTSGSGFSPRVPAPSEDRRGGREVLLCCLKITYKELPLHHIFPLTPRFHQHPFLQIQCLRIHPTLTLSQMSVCTPGTVHTRCQIHQLPFSLFSCIFSLLLFHHVLDVVVNDLEDLVVSKFHLAPPGDPPHHLLDERIEFFQNVNIRSFLFHVNYITMSGMSKI